MMVSPRFSHPGHGAGSLPSQPGVSKREALGLLQKVVLDSQGRTHRFEFAEHIPIYAMDVVAMKVPDEALRAAVETSKGMGPVVLGERGNFFPPISQIDQLRRERRQTVGPIAARQPCQGEGAGGGQMINGRTSCRRIEALGSKLGSCEVDLGVKALGCEIGGMLPTVAQVPQIEVFMIVTDVREQNRGLCQMFEDLHGQGAVAVRLRGADDRRLC